MFYLRLGRLSRFTHIRRTQLEKFLDDVTLYDTGGHAGQLLDVGIEQSLKDPVLAHDPRRTEYGHLERAARDDRFLLVKVAGFHWELCHQLCLWEKRSRGHKKSTALCFTCITSLQVLFVQYWTVANGIIYSYTPSLTMNKVLLLQHDYIFRCFSGKMKPKLLLFPIFLRRQTHTTHSGTYMEAGYLFHCPEYDVTALVRQSNIDCKLFILQKTPREKLTAPIFQELYSCSELIYCSYSYVHKIESIAKRERVGR